MDDEEQPCKCPPPGLPLWMGTFADLMSLLMCFFVLLLSFSEMDVLKFKQIAGSMKFAFGVQNRLEVKDIPKGTSIIAQEFRPGRPEPTPIDVIMQQTIDITQQTLEFQEGESDRAGGAQRDAGKLDGGQSPQTSTESNQNSESQQQQQQAEAMSEEEVDSTVEKIKKALQREIQQGGGIIHDIDHLIKGYKKSRTGVLLFYSQSASYCGVGAALLAFPDETGSLYKGSPCIILISTRRFSARCAGVSLGTNGSVSARPRTCKRSWSKPWTFSISCATETARCEDKSHKER